MSDIPPRSLDPLQILPPELWVDIIRQSISDEASEDRYYVDKLLDFLNVSSLWSGLLLSTPTLWSLIIIDEEQDDFQAKLCTVLHLSKGAHISIVIYELEWDKHSQLLDYLLPNKERITSVVFLCGWEFSQMVDFLHECLPCTNLLHVDRARHFPSSYLIVDLYALFTVAPYLRSLDGFAILSESIEDITMPTTIHTMTAVTPSEAALLKLSMFPGLHTLILIDFAADIPTQEDVSALSTHHHRLPYSFLSLQTLQIMCHYKPFSHLVVSCPNLRELTITEFISIKQTSALFETLQASPRLTRLAVEVTLDGLLEVRGVYLPQITQLILKAYVGDENERGHDFHVKFFDCLAIIMPSVEYLDLGNDRKFLRGLFYAQSLFNLKMIQLRSPELDINLPQPYFTLSYVTTLTSTEGVSEELFRLIQFPNLVSATIYFPPTYLRKISSGPTLIPRLGPNVPPYLTHLDIHLQEQVFWDLSAFHQLQSITFLSSFDLVPHSTSFLAALLRTPRSCPCLNNINVKDGRWEWDLLILLLERRNLLQDPNIASITRIGMLGTPPYKLLLPITQLLGGERMEHDSLEEYSLEAVAKLLFNSTLNGCEICCWMFTSCDAALYPSEADVGFDAFSKGFGEEPEAHISDPPLPQRMKIWLSKASERRRKFIQEGYVASKLFRRCFSCRPERKLRDVKITSTSLYGACYADEEEVESGERRLTQ